VYQFVAGVAFDGDAGDAVGSSVRGEHWMRLLTVTSTERATRNQNDALVPR
jgi:hypothetical protein